MTLLRTESFVPLAPAPAHGERADLRVTVTSAGDVRSAFEPLKSASPPQMAVTASAGACEPRVSVSREGDRVVSIRVQCSCGQVLDLACVYPEPAK